MTLQRGLLMFCLLHLGLNHHAVGLSLESLQFKPSPLPYASDSVVLKFGGSRVLKQCGLSTGPCNPGYSQDASTCQRQGCCWNEESGTCTKPSMQIMRNEMMLDPAVEPVTCDAVGKRRRRRRRNTSLNYIVFVVDDTGSMANEIGGVRQWLHNCVNSAPASGAVSGPTCGSPPSGGWLLQTFNDPTIGVPVGPTTSHSDMDSAISLLVANGGGDCPELAFTGVLSALEQIPDDNSNCKVFFFTDATPLDPQLAGDAMMTLLAKGCAFIPILTGCCGSCAPLASTGRRKKRSFNQYIGNDGYPLDDVTHRDVILDDVDVDSLEELYYGLAEETGGEVYLIEKPDSPEAYTASLESAVGTLGYCPTDVMVTHSDGTCLSSEECEEAGHCFDESVNVCYEN